MPNRQKLSNIYKNTKLKLLKTNAAILFNKMCKVKELKPGYINIKINGNTPQDRKTTHNTVKFRTNQEIKFLYRKKQHLNQQLYQLHLEGALPTQWCVAARIKLH
jgi:hypothetical protein